MKFVGRFHLSTFAKDITCGILSQATIRLISAPNYVIMLPNEKDIEEAICALRSGKVIGFPTDTVYGLGANPFIKGGVDRIFEIKGRSRELALPLLLADIDDIQTYASNIPDSAWKLVEQFLPGGLTIVLQKSAKTPIQICGNRSTIALRVPDHPIPRLLASELSTPITGTSANFSGKSPCTNGDCVKNQFKGLVNVVIDRGTIKGKESSTVIDATTDSIKLIRRGAVKVESIEQIIGYTLEAI